MAPVYGKNGFSDCKVICDPKNGYSIQTCIDECQGIYNYTTTALNNIYSTTQTTTVLSIPFENLTTIPPDINSGEGTNELFYFMIGSILLFLTVLLILVICFRKRIFKYMQNRIQWLRSTICEIRYKQQSESSHQMDILKESQNLLKDTTVNVDKTNENLKNKTTSIEAFFMSMRSSRKALDNNENADKIVTNVAEICDNGIPSTSTNMVANDSLLADHDEADSEDDTDTETDVENDDNSKMAMTNGGNKVSKSKGIVRVITEINLR